MDKEEKLSLQSPECFLEDDGDLFPLESLGSVPGSMLTLSVLIG